MPTVGSSTRSFSFTKTEWGNVWEYISYSFTAFISSIRKSTATLPTLPMPGSPPRRIGLLSLGIFPICRILRQLTAIHFLSIELPLFSYGIGRICQAMRTWQAMGLWFFARMKGMPALMYSSCMTGSAICASYCLFAQESAYAFLFLNGFYGCLRNLL